MAPTVNAYEKTETKASENSLTEDRQKHVELQA
jgi:hypothetical protein